MSKGGEPYFAHTPVTLCPDTALPLNKHNFIDFVCTSSMDNICTASLTIPKSTSPKAVQNPLSPRVTKPTYRHGLAT